MLRYGHASAGFRQKFCLFAKAHPLGDTYARADTCRGELPKPGERFPDRRGTGFFPESSACGDAGSTARCLRVKPKAATERGHPLGPNPQRAASLQDLVSWRLAAISPVAALRATRMWLSETNYGAFPDLWITATVCTPSAGEDLFYLAGRKKGKVIFALHGAVAFSRRPRHKAQIVFNHRLSQPHPVNQNNFVP